MSRIKKCELPDCHNPLGNSHKILRFIPDPTTGFSSLVEHKHMLDENGKCKIYGCGTTHNKPIKKKVCKACYEMYEPSGLIMQAEPDDLTVKMMEDSFKLK